MHEPGPREALRPDVSIVVIAYNESDHAEGCVHAILGQETDRQFELIFVDDGSRDETSNIVRRAAGSDARLHLVPLPTNVGRGAARSAGVAAARGRAIAFVDADITLPPDWLDRCLAELPGRAAVSGIAVPDGHTAVLARITGAAPRQVPGSMPITGSNVLFDAEVFAKTGFDPRDRLGEDTRLAARLLKAGHRLGRVPGLVVRHEESKTYWRELRWRFMNGIDASSLPRLLGIRFADLVWVAWLAAWIVAVVGTIILAPSWLLLGLGASAAAGVVHAASRFERRPVGRFAFACLANIPLLTAYLLGRTIGIPRLVLGRP